MLAIAVLVLSIAPVLNLLSGKQMMNTSFTRLPLVNTYGAFGSVGRERNELVFEGTTDAEITAATRWQAYEFKCKPGDPARRPCWMSPYHYRLDWLLWFAAMGRPRDYPWAVHLVWKLLSADPATLALLAHDPFGGAPPRHVRVELYRYRLAPRGAPGWWQRERIGEWLPPVLRNNAELRTYLARQGFLRRLIRLPGKGRPVFRGSDCDILLPGQPLPTTDPRSTRIQRRRRLATHSPLLARRFHMS